MLNRLSDFCSLPMFKLRVIAGITIPFLDYRGQHRAEHPCCWVQARADGFQSTLLVTLSAAWRHFFYYYFFTLFSLLQSDFMLHEPANSRKSEWRCNLAETSGLPPAALRWIGSLMQLLPFQQLQIPLHQTYGQKWSIFVFFSWEFLQQRLTSWHMSNLYNIDFS